MSNLFNNNFGGRSGWLMCYPGRTIPLTSEIEIRFNMNLRRVVESSRIYPLSSVFVNLNRLLAVNSFIRERVQLKVPMTTTVIYLQGLMLQNGEELRTTERLSRPWEGTTYSLIERNICLEISQRIGEDSILQTMEVQCGMIFVEKLSSLGTAYVSMSNEQLTAAGIALTYEAVGLAVQNAVLRRELHRGGTTYFARLQEPNFLKQMTHYLLRGTMTFNGSSVQFPTQNQATQSTLLRDAIEQICRIARTHSSQSVMFNNHIFSCKLQQYNTINDDVTVLITASVEGTSSYVETRVAAQTYPFPLSDEVIEYRATLIHNEIIRPEQQVSDDPYIMYRAAFTHMGQPAINSIENAVIVFQNLKDRACTSMISLETTDTTPILIEHHCRYMSFDPIGMIVTMKISIPQQALINQNLSIGDIGIKCKEQPEEPSTTTTTTSA